MGLPILWKQIGDFVIGIIGKAGQNIFEIGKGLDAVSLGRCDQGVDDRGTLAPFK